MSLLRDIIQEVNSLRAQLDQQEHTVGEFLRQNRDQITLVREALAGSQGGHDLKMLECLRETETSLKECQAQIRQARTAIMCIEMI